MVPGFFVGGFGGCQSCLGPGVWCYSWGNLFHLLFLKDTKSANQKNPVLKEKAHQKTMFTTRCPYPFPIPLSLPLQTDSLPKNEIMLFQKLREFQKPALHHPLIHR